MIHKQHPSITVSNVHRYLIFVTTIFSQASQVAGYPNFPHSIGLRLRELDTEN